MTSKVRHLRHPVRHSTISVERLFAAAFQKPGFIYQRESLLGWRPISIDAGPQDLGSGQSMMPEEPPLFANSQDVRVRETSKAITIEVTLPEINEESLYLEISQDLLIIRAEKADAGTVETESRYEMEKSLIHRYIKLPVMATPGNVKARLEGNVVYIKIDKPSKGFGEVR